MSGTGAPPPHKPTAVPGASSLLAPTVDDTEDYDMDGPSSPAVIAQSQSSVPPVAPATVANTAPVLGKPIGLKAPLMAGASGGDDYDDYDDDGDATPAAPTPATTGTGTGTAVLGTVPTLTRPVPILKKPTQLGGDQTQQGMSQSQQAILADKARFLVPGDDSILRFSDLFGPSSKTAIPDDKEVEKAPGTSSKTTAVRPPAADQSLIEGEDDEIDWIQGLSQRRVAVAWRKRKKSSSSSTQLVVQPRRKRRAHIRAALSTVPRLLDQDQDDDALDAVPLPDAWLPPMDPIATERWEKDVIWDEGDIELRKKQRQEELKGSVTPSTRHVPPVRSGTTATASSSATPAVGGATSDVEMADAAPSTATTAAPTSSTGVKVSFRVAGSKDIDVYDPKQDLLQSSMGDDESFQLTAQEARALQYQLPRPQELDEHLQSPETQAAVEARKQIRIALEKKRDKSVNVSEDFLSLTEEQETIPVDPELEAGRSKIPVKNLMLENGAWEYSITWDSDDEPEAPPVYLDMEDAVLVLENKAEREAAERKRKAAEELRARRLGKKKDKKKKGDKTDDDHPLHRAWNDYFNASNDIFYDTPTGGRVLAKVARPEIVHSLPAVRLSLVPTQYLVSDLRFFHRPPLQTHTITDTWKVSKDAFTPAQPSSMRPTGTGQTTFRRIADLTSARGHTMMIEYTDEQPFLMANVGMGMKVFHIYRQKNLTDQTEPNLKLGDLRLLEPREEPPFLGDVAQGSSLTVLDNNIITTPIAEHPTNETDFLLLRSTAKPDQVYIRRIDFMYTAAQIQPLMEVYAPQSKQAKEYMSHRLAAAMYRFFRKYPNDCIRASDLVKAFAPLKHKDIAKRLEDFAVYQGVEGESEGYWVKKAGAYMPTDQELRTMLTPENVCVYESMRAGFQRVKDMGFDRTAEEYQLVSSAVAEATGKEAVDVLEEEALRTPWVWSHNFVNAIHGRVLLELTPEVSYTGSKYSGFTAKKLISLKEEAKKEQAEQLAREGPKKVINPGSVMKGVAVEGTGADLRKLTLEQSRELLSKFGVKDEIIESLSRWRRIALVRKLSSQAASLGAGDVTTQFARSVRFSYQQRLNEYKEQTKHILDTQVEMINGGDEEDVTKPTMVLRNLKGALAAGEDGGEGEGQEEGQAAPTSTPTPAAAAAAASAASTVANPADPAAGAAGASTDGAAVNGVVADADGDVIRVKRRVGGRTKIEYIRDPELVKALRRYQELNTVARKGLNAKKKAQERARALQTQIMQGIEDDPSTYKKERKKKVPSAPKRDKDVTCSACGQKGHMKSNRICEYYGREPPPKVKKRRGRPPREGGPVPRSRGGRRGRPRKDEYEEEEGLTDMEETASDADIDIDGYQPSKTVRRGNARTQLGHLVTETLAHIKDLEHAEPFKKPVSHRAFKDYKSIVRNPMDLQTMSQKPYDTVIEFLADLRLIGANCRLYNSTHFENMVGQGEEIFRAAVQFLKAEESVVRASKLVAVIDDELRNRKGKDQKWYHTFARPVEDASPDGYYSVVKTPMDLGTMRSNAINLEYESDEDFLTHLDLIAANCHAWHDDRSPQFANMGDQINTEIRELLERYSYADKEPEVDPEILAAEEAAKAALKDVDSDLTEEQRELKSILQAVMSELSKESGFIDALYMTTYEPRYAVSVRRPLDYNIIQDKVTKSEYASAEDFIQDVRLFAANCYHYFGAMGKGALGNSLSAKAQIYFQRHHPGLISSSGMSESSESILKDPSEIPPEPVPVIKAIKIKQPKAKPGPPQRNPLHPKLRQVLRYLQTHESFETFRVTPTEKVAPGYSKVIERPTAVSTVKQNLRNPGYTLEEFVVDFRRIASNCATYNDPLGKIVDLGHRFVLDALEHLESLGVKEEVVTSTVSELKAELAEIMSKKPPPSPKPEPEPAPPSPVVEVPMDTEISITDDEPVSEPTALPKIRIAFAAPQPPAGDAGYIAESDDDDDEADNEGNDAMDVDDGAGHQGVRATSKKSGKKLAPLMNKALTKSQSHKFWGIFAQPVDTATFTDYLDIISQPMDMGTIQERVDQAYYEEEPHLFFDDLRLVASNCATFNEADDDWREAGNTFIGHILKFCRKEKQFEPLRRYIDGKPSESDGEDGNAGSAALRVKLALPVAGHGQRKASHDSHATEETDYEVEQDGDGVQDAPSIPIADLPQASQQALNVLSILETDPHYSIFAEPVDPSVAPDYDQVITTPMYLSKIMGKARQGLYRTERELFADFELIASNCRRYNASRNPHMMHWGEQFVERARALVEGRDLPSAVPPPVVPLVPTATDATDAVAGNGNDNDNDNDSGQPSQDVSMAPAPGEQVSTPAAAAAAAALAAPAPAVTPQAPVAAPAVAPASVAPIAPLALAPTQVPVVEKPSPEAIARACETSMHAIEKHDLYKTEFINFRLPVNLADFPDYPEKVKDPITLAEIEAKYKAQQYTDINDYVKDLWQISINCHRYNDGVRDGFACAGDRMVEAALKHLRRLYPAIFNQITVPRPRESIQADPTLRVQHLERVKDYLTGLQEAILTLNPKGSLFAKRVNHADFPDYKDIVDKPVDLNSLLKGKIQKKKYTDISEFIPDIELMAANCRLYNTTNTTNIGIAEFGFDVLKWVEERMQKNPLERALSLSSYLQHVLDTAAQFPYYVEFEKAPNKKLFKNYGTIIKTPMYFALIRPRVQRMYYVSTEEFLQDVQLIADNCRQYNTETGSPQYAELGQQLVNAIVEWMNQHPFTYP